MGIPALLARMYDGTMADALAGTEMIRSGRSAIRRFMFWASTAGSNTELRTVTSAPCFSRPLFTVFAHAAQNGFWFVQMMTPTFFPDRSVFWPLAPSAPETTTAATTASAASGTQRNGLRLMSYVLSDLTIDERRRSGSCLPPVRGWTVRNRAS